MMRKKRLDNPRYVRFINLVQADCNASAEQILALLDDCNFLDNDSLGLEEAVAAAIAVLTDPDYWKMLEREQARMNKDNA